MHFRTRGFLFDWNKQFELSLDRKRRARCTMNLCGRFYKEAKFCSMCGPKFCSMNITQLAEAESGKDKRSGSRNSRSSL